MTGNEQLASDLERLCCAETEGKFFDLVTDSIGTIIAALREIERLRAALKPFAAFAEKAETFVADRAKDGGSPIMPPSSDFRLADFQRARAAMNIHKGTDDAKP